MTYARFFQSHLMIICIDNTSRRCNYTLYLSGLSQEFSYLTKITENGDFGQRNYLVTGRSRISLISMGESMEITSPIDII